MSISTDKQRRNGWFKRFRMPVLPPPKNAVVPKPRPISLGKTLRYLLIGLFWFVVFSLFVGLQLGIGYMVHNVPTPFPVVLCIALLGTLILIVGKEKRWRMLLFVGFFVIMSGQLGWFFGSAVLSTFVIEGAISLALTAFVLIDAISRRRKHFPPSSILLLMFALLAITLAAVWQQESVTDHRTTRTLVIQVVLGIGLFLGGFIYFNRWNQINTFFKLILGGALFFATLGVIEYFLNATFYNYYLQVFPAIIRRVNLALMERRIFGTFDNPVVFGSWLAMFVPLGMYWVLQAKTAASKFWSWTFFFILLLALFFTGSRGPFLAAGLGIVILPFVIGRPRLGKVLLVASVAAGFYLFLVGPQVARLLPENNLLVRVVDPASAKFSGDTTFSTFTTVRLLSWQQGFVEWKQNALLGIGPGEWVEQRRRSTDRDVLLVVSAYSPYLLQLVETGALGAGALLIILILLVRWNIWAVRNTPVGPKRDLVGALVVALLVVHLVSLTDVGYAINRIYFFFWLVQGIVLKAPYVARQEQEVAFVEEAKSGPEVQPEPVPQLTGA